MFACAGHVHARGETSVWTVKGKTNTVYLAGSVHALPKEHAQFPEQLERAYGAVKVVVLEVDLDDMDPLEAVQFITANGTLPAEQTLVDVVGAKDYERVAKLAAHLGVPEAAIKRLEPWAVALVLTQFALTKTGFDAQLGIDMQITERAKADGKTIEGLETVIDQLSVFDARSFDEQTRFLLDSTDDAEHLDADLSKLISAWRSGDLRALEKEFIKERAKSPALYDALLGVRNRKWLPKIEALLDDDQDYLVLVGTLHYVGKDGLLSLLQERGYKPVSMPATLNSSICAAMRSFSSSMSPTSKRPENQPPQTLMPCSFRMGSSTAGSIGKRRPVSMPVKPASRACRRHSSSETSSLNSGRSSFHQAIGAMPSLALIFISDHDFRPPLAAAPRKNCRNNAQGVSHRSGRGRPRGAPDKLRHLCAAVCGLRLARNGPREPVRDR